MIVHKTMAWGVSAAAMALAIGLPAAAHAQAKQTPPATDVDKPALPAEADKSADPASGDIIVTAASRITTAGFEAPTPTTVVGPAELRQGGRTDLQAALSDLPEIRQTVNPTATNSVLNSGQAPADIRGLGSSRTLVLVNGHRFVSSDDLQTIPFALTKQVDVVTGGASAAWGSDAVAGVINVVLDDKLKGLTVNVQSGISQLGDGSKQFASAAFGTNITDRWHFMIGGDYLNDHGIQPATSRPREGNTFLVAGADGVLRPTQNLLYSGRSYGGLINTGVLAGQTFNPDGSLRTFQLGRVVGALMVGGDKDGYYNDQVRSLVAPLERGTVFARTSYDITDHFKVWAEANYSKTSNERDYFPDLGPSQISLTYSAQNPYLSPTIQAQLTAAGQPSFNMTRVLADIGIVRYRFEREVKEGSVGFNGDIGNNWHYSGFYTHGEETQNLQLFGLIKTAPFLQAIDAVTGPAGTPVCRIALTNPTTTCLPINLFGQNRFNPAAIANVTGNWQNIQKNYLDEGGLSVNGEPFRLYNRPVSVAAGINYREQARSSIFDPISLAGGFASVNGTNVPKIGNNVKEAFVEVAAPVLADLPFVQELTLNGAARVSKYSTFGDEIWSWKIGAVWKISDDLKLRVARSRDIRAANLVELYSTPTTVFNNSIIDPTRPVGQQQTQVILNTGGNPNLAPEKGDTLTVGGVLTPRIAHGLSLSVDYYNIKIANVISTLSAQQIVNLCVQGNSSTCAQVIRDPSGAINTINATYINVARFDTSGIDGELSYHTRLNGIGLPGALSVRNFVNWVDHLVSNNGISTVNGVGYSGAYADFLVPRWRANTTINYEGKSVGVDLRGRFISASGYAPYQLLGATSAAGVDARIPAYFYVDLTLRGYIPFGIDKSRRLTIYTSVSNLFDTDPPIAAINTPYYDVIGRYITVGATLKF